MTSALSVKHLTKHFGGGKKLLGGDKPKVHAVNNISFDVNSLETLGIVGESGCGKSTLARMLVGLIEPTSGHITIDQKDLSEYGGKDPAAFGRLIQYVFQDPISSLNPRKTISQIMQTPLRELYNIRAQEAKQRIYEIFDAVNLRHEFLERYPHEFSGGQAQRIGIARALVAKPKILILDEPVSALDVSVQAQVLNLLEDLKQEFSLTYLFITHDLAVVEAIANRVAVLYFGELVELADADKIFAQPKHPYTQLLAHSAPQIGKALHIPETEETELPNPLQPPKGCPFYKRCVKATSLCQEKKPVLEEKSNGHFAACHES